MAVYKVIQDVEAEDKLLGPLSLKGFIYAAGAGLFVFISVRLAISGVATPFKLGVILFLLPPTILLGVLASPLGREQPTEVWLLSHLKFLIKPRTRKWDQSGLKQLVKVTAPKREEKRLVKDLSQTEVTSRLQALANTLDSRGWAVKNANVTMATQPVAVADTSDRLAEAASEAQAVEPIDVRAADDILDEENPRAQNLDSMMQQAEQERRVAVQNRLEAARSEAIMNPAPSTSPGSEVTEEEKQLLERVHERDRKLAETQLIIKGPSTPAVTSPSRAAKLELAQSGNDFSVATIAHLAKKANEEVVVPLHQ